MVRMVGGASRARTRVGLPAWIFFASRFRVNDCNIRASLLSFNRVHAFDFHFLISNLSLHSGFLSSHGI